MAIKFEKIEAGMTLYDRHRERMGNTTMTSIGEWKVRVISVDPVNRSAVVSWNGNRPEEWYDWQLKKLSTWSKNEDDVEINGKLRCEVGPRDDRVRFATYSVKKLSKKAFDERRRLAEAKSVLVKEEP